MSSFEWLLEKSFIFLMLKNPKLFLKILSCFELNSCVVVLFEFLCGFYGFSFFLFNVKLSIFTFYFSENTYSL